MTRLSLYINKMEAVLTSVQSLGLSLNREFTDLKNPEKRSADFSFSLSLPKCPENNRLFNQAQEAHIIDKFNRIEDFEAELFADGKLVISGFFRLREVNKENYSGNLYSSAISWADSLSQFTLQTITNADGSTWETPFNLAGGADTIQSYQVKTADTSDIIFPLVAYHPFPNSSPLAGKFTIDLNSDFTYKYFAPAVYYVNILKKCFESIGYEVSSELFQEEDFKRLALPYVNDVPYQFNFRQLHGVDAEGLKASLNLEFIAPYGAFGQFDRLNGILVNEGITSGYELLQAVDVITKNTDDNAYNTFALGEYNVTYDGVYDLKFTLEDFNFIKDQNNDSTPFERIALVAIDESITTPALAAVETNIKDYLAQTVVDEITNTDIKFFADFFNGYSTIQGTTFNRLINYTVEPSNIGTGVVLKYPAVPNSGPVDDISISSGPLELSAGQQLRFYLVTYSKDYTFYAIPPPGGGWVSMYVYDKLRVEVNSTFDDEINIGKNLPEINAKDFISDFIKLTNSYFITDEERKTVNFFTFPKLHLNAEQGYNWDGASIEDAILKPYTSPRELKLNYSIDGDDNLVAGTNYGNLTRISSNIFSQGKKEIKVAFSSTLFRQAFHNRAGSVSFLVPNIMSQQQFDQNPDSAAFVGGYVARLLQITGKLELSPSRTINVDGEEVDIILCSFDGTPPHPTQQALSTINLKFSDSPGDLPSLFEKYYKNFFLLTERGHLVELSGCLTSSDWQNMTFEKLVLFDSEQFYLISIKNFNPITPGSAIVSLLKRV